MRIADKSRFRARQWVLVIACLLGGGAGACKGLEQGPSVSTETGNPPSVDGLRVALVVAGSELRITGAPGAVAPLPATVFVTDVLSGEVSHAAVQADGSFDLAVPIGEGQVYEVRAAAGILDAAPGAEELSAAVVVSRGSAQVFRADAQLSCSDQSNAAADLLAALAERADRGCETVADCVLADDVGACDGSCTTVPMSIQGHAAFEAAGASLAPAICPGFFAGDCQRTLLPCPFEGNVAACVAGQCVAAPAAAAQPDTCGCPSEAIEWSHYGGVSGVLETRRYGGCFGYNGLSYSDALGTSCVQVLPLRCNEPGAVLATDDFMDALDHPDVRAAIAAGELPLPVMEPDGALSLRISDTDGSSAEFVLPLACAGTQDCALPEGIQAFVDLLIRTESDAPDCQQCASPLHNADDGTRQGCSCDEQVASPTCATTAGPNGERVEVGLMECVGVGRWQLTADCPPITVP